jgi:hypothetical protein
MVRLTKIPSSNLLLDLTGLFWSLRCNCAAALQRSVPESCAGLVVNTGLEKTS